MKKKKKLLILVNQLSFFISHRLPIARAALNDGFEVVIVYGELGNTDISLNLLEDEGFKIRYIPMDRSGINILRDLKTCFHIWKFFKVEKPDIVHLISMKPYLYGGIISRLLNIRAVVSAISGFGTLFISKNLKFKILGLLFSPIFKFSFNHSNQMIIVQNESDLKLLIKFGILNLSKIKIFKGSGVKLENFVDLKEPSGIPTVCFAARLLRDKGIYEFVSAAKILNERGIQARFLIAGDLDLNNLTGIKFDEYNKLKNEKSIEVLGYHKNIPELYAKSHIVCLPSYREGLPKSLMEAAAASRAVVTTDVPGCRDAIIPNKTGLLVPVKDPNKLADSLQWLIEHPKERVDMGKEGRKLAEKEFRIEKIAEDHLIIYKQLIPSQS